jgi:hypothetical protein
MIAFFVTDRLAFGSKLRLKRHTEKLRELGITHVIDVRMYPAKNSESSRRSISISRTMVARAQCGSMLERSTSIEMRYNDRTPKST